MVLELTMQGHNGEYYALHTAISYSSIEKLQSLLDGGADVNLQDKGGCTALSLAKSYKLKKKKN